MIKFMLIAMASLGHSAVTLVDAFPGLSFEQPVFMTQAHDASGRFFVVEQPGRIRVFSKGSPKSKVFLDISKKARTDSPEEGLLCMAFHPQFKKNGYFYAVYSLKGARPRRTVIARFSVSKNDPDQADPASETEIFSVEKPYSNHNGSCLLFDKDGLLYVSLGDGGAGGDPHGNAQNPKSLLGKILRLNVDHPSGIEVYALGLRNVWRMSFDALTGELWAGDVGQDSYEEIDLIQKGGNYGWNYYEGTHHFKGQAGNKKLIPPVLDYSRKDGFCVTGGYVYRGKRLPSLYGTYLFGDFGSRQIWGLTKGTKKREILRCQQAVSSFAQDNADELYVLGYDGTIFEFK